MSRWMLAIGALLCAAWLLAGSFVGVALLFSGSWAVSFSAYLAVAVAGTAFGALGAFRGGGGRLLRFAAFLGGVICASEAAVGLGNLIVFLLTHGGD